MKIFRLPDLGEGLQEAELVEWRVEAGQTVAADQPLVAVETAKAVVEIPSPQAGRIERLFANPGDIVHIDAPLVGFESASSEENESASVVGAVAVGAAVLRETVSAPSHGGGGGVRAAPAVRALAHKLGVELNIVTPSGPDGVITALDVQRVARILSEAEPLEPLRGVRRAMAQNMALAHAEVVAATVMDDADIENWPQGTDITLRLIRALVAGCRAEPALNAWYESQSFGRRVLRRIDLGVATDSPEGLFVPVLRDIGARSPADLREGLNRMRADMAARSIAPHELRGATITLSNFGTIAGRYAAPVVLPPTVAILGAGRVRAEVVAFGGAPMVRRTLPLSLTFDHRVVTGGEAARFLAAAMADLSGTE
ncbi:dihydrolipoamide acetyltransferase family protein [Methylocystis heyeri]|uniref:Dihydrolipoamide acetyltransferase component of pyruvate dehydrogenase complex n=1 Tax=Methylocystis heyeri TaxID=391905 RepID=A0A6B8KIC7_9HYPH|nr:dihydrolipoamide acetyltransferase family protein [Methylocystis heyeri]QGM47249.1 2-oxo acid dehydrogenase subunit E2 [Methylocystis heyeri]